MLNNGATGEDDYATATLTVTGVRTAGIAPMLSCPAGSTIFDWDVRSWTAGTMTNAYALDAIGQISFALANPGVWLNVPEVGGQSPTRQNVVHAGTNQYSLLQLVDLADRISVVTSTITLPAIMRGAQFTLFDVDYASGQFADRVRVIGRYKGTTITPVLTNGVANYVVGNEAFGDGASNNDQANGNVVVTFNQPVDTIILYYGNHALAPANPGQQGITIHDITMCRPTTNISVTKTNIIVNDPVSGTDNPKAIPGATVKYCIFLQNTGDTTAANVVATDSLPMNATYVAGSLKSGSACSSATVAEDDDDIGTDEADPYGASMATDTVRLRASSLATSASFAITFDVKVN